MSSRAAPREQDRVRSDDAVVAEAEHRDGVDLEVEVRLVLGVTGVADEADHVARLDLAPSTASGEYAERCA